MERERGAGRAAAAVRGSVWAAAAAKPAKQAALWTGATQQYTPGQHSYHSHSHYWPQRSLLSKREKTNSVCEQKGAKCSFMNTEVDWPLARRYQTEGGQ